MSSIVDGILSILSDIYCALVTILFSFYFLFKRRVVVPKVANGILLRSATKLAEQIRRGEITSAELVQALIDRNYVIQPIINAIVEDNFEEALQQARRCDEELGKMSQEERAQLAVTKPLFGLPYTVKDSIQVKGKKITWGLYCWKDVRAAENAVVIDRLNTAGAFLLAMTNVPELCIWVEGNNSIYGYTNNPYDNRRMVGGSSSGEGALVAACGSVLGIGSDVGGSIRIPSAMNGIFGLKTTPNVVPLDKISQLNNKYLNEFLSIGPMVKKSEDMLLLYRVLGGEEAFNVLQQTEQNFSVEKVYALRHNAEPGVPKLAKDQRVALEEVIAYVSTRYQAQVDNVDISHWRKDVFECFYYNAFNDKNFPGFEFLHEMVDGKYNTFCEFVRWCLGKSKHSLSGAVKAFRDRRPKSPADHEYIMNQLKSHRKEAEAIVGSNALVIMPTWPHVAPYHNQPIAHWKTLAIYTLPWNIVGLPVVVIPMGLNSDGLPLSVAISGPKGSDGLLMDVARQLESRFGGWVEPLPL